MDFSKVINISDLHHAYILEDGKDSFEALQKFLKDSYKNAEIHIRDFDSLGIDDSRTLAHLASMRSLGIQLFILNANSCTREAQNALLKLFEEPPERTHFFLSLSGSCDILPTLRSRVRIVSAHTKDRGDTLGKKFISATFKERIIILEPIVKEKDVHAAEMLLSDIEREMHERKEYIVHGSALQHILEVRRVIKDKGASLKVLMESVALTTPQLS